MTIKTWSSYNKRRNSTAAPASAGTTHTVTLKRPTSIIHPVFVLDTYSLSDNYLQWGSRYYFIDDIILLNNDLAEYHCTVDALSSWKTAIGNSSEFVARSAITYDGILPDTFYPVQNGCTYSDDQFDVSSQMEKVNGTFVIGVVGPTPASGSIGYYALSASTFSQLLDYMFDENNILDMSAADIQVTTQKELVNPFQYVVSVNWFPFTISTGHSSTIKFGWWDSGLSADVITIADRTYNIYKSITLSAHPEAATRGGYLNGSPFTRRQLYCFTFGQIPLDANHFVRDKTCAIDIDVDLFTGGGRLQVLAKDPDNHMVEIERRYAQFCCPVQLAQMATNVVDAAISTIGAMGDALTMAGVLGATGGAAAPISGGMISGMASSVGSAVNSLMPQCNITGSTGSTVDFYGNPRVVSSYYYQAPMDEAHNGRPLCQRKTINTLSGYIKCENADVDIPGTKEERDMIAHYMNTGFYYE